MSVSLVGTKIPRSTFYLRARLKRFTIVLTSEFPRASKPLLQLLRSGVQLSMANRDLIHLEEQRIHLKKLLTEVRLSPDFRTAIELHLLHVEELITQAKNPK